MTDTPGPARQVALAVVGFLATLILLFGLINVVGRSAVSGVGVASPSPAVVRPSGSDASAGSSAPSPVPSPSGDPVLVGAGDIADCALDGDSATAALLDSIGGTVFTAGDNAYPDGTIDQFRDCYAPTWGRHLSRTRPAPGNHDRNTRDLAGYLAYFGTAAAPDGVPWYSYDLGTWHVVVLDSNCGAAGGCGLDSAQGRWLVGDLAASAASCTIAIWHHPRFSSGEHGDDRDVGPFWQALYDAGAEIVINGHDHDYERFAPQDPSGREDRARGIREFVVGTGGAALRDFQGTAANSELRLSVTFGVLRLVLHEGTYDWSFIPTSGDVTDGGSGRCH
jgi:hypothetical protein